MNLFNLIENRKESVSVIGLGYVGLPLAVSLARKINVIGFDLNEKKIELYKNGIDVTEESGDQAVKNSSAVFTADEKQIENALLHIIAVPTPINADKTPNLKPVIGASEIVGRHMKKGSIIVYESTVFPGATEEICIPILEEMSGLKHGIDFKVGYSPERINPGDKKHRLENIVKVVSGYDQESLDVIASVYELIIEAGVFKASSIKVAEAAKVIENSQRDLNIAFVNELSIIFDKMGIDTLEVLEAAGTKWNFLNFRPGLVGGHCIGVDPYYLTYKSEMLGYKPEVILSGRRINDNMGKYIAEKTVKKLIECDTRIKGAKVLIMGLTFKENCSDLRNSKVIDVINELEEYGIDVHIYDPIVDYVDAMNEYGVKLSKLDEISCLDGIVCCVAHNEFLKIPVEDFNKMYCDEDKGKTFIDVKGFYDKEKFMNHFNYWRL